MLISILKNLEMSLINDYQSESKNCPSCNKMVYKKSNQMYCYHCFTGFDWDSLEIISTPLSYIPENENENFMKFYIHKNLENQFSFRIPNDYNRLKTIYKNLFRLQKILLDYKVDYISYNKNLRNALINGDVNDDEFNIELEKRGVKMNIKREIFEILKNYIVETFKCVYSFVDFWKKCNDKWNMAWIYSPMGENYKNILKTTKEKLENYEVNFNLTDDFYM